MCNLEEVPTTLKEEPVIDIFKEDLLYGVELLFTNIPVKKTVDKILAELYDPHKIKPMCSNTTFT